MFQKAGTNPHPFLASILQYVSYFHKHVAFFYKAKAFLFRFAAKCLISHTRGGLWEPGPASAARRPAYGRGTAPQPTPGSGGVYRLPPRPPPAIPPPRGGAQLKTVSRSAAENSCRLV